jgi:Tol biopolymer transport system component
MLRSILIGLALTCLSSYAHAQFSGSLPFGKNKLQYESFSWRVIQSENIDVYFHGDGESTARYAAVAAEKALTKIQDELSFTVTKRIAFVVYNSHNQFQQTNVIDQYLSEGIGGVTELFKNRIVIPFDGSYQQFAHVIHHELVHAVLNDMFYGGSMQSLVNNSARAIVPLWWNEGFAEYSSVGGLDIKTDQFMRDVAVSEYLRGFQQLNGYFAYRGGQSFWWYVAEKYGKGKIGEVFNRFRVLGDVEQTFKAAFGMTGEELSDQWAKDIKRYYFPDVDRYEYVEDFASRLTNHQKEANFYNTSPALSPDGERVAFISDRDQVFGIYLMELATKDVTKILSSARTADFEELNILTPGISWSPDGKRLAISAKAGGNDAIYLVDVDDGEYFRFDLGFKTLGTVAWSPDGTTIAFAGSKGDGRSDIYLWKPGSKTVQALTNDVFSDADPAWAPDSKTVYFLSDRGSYTGTGQPPTDHRMWKHDVSQQDIYRITIDASSIERVTSDPTVGKSSIVVAPNGTSILYVADYNGIANLWELQLSSGNRRARTNALQEIAQISLSNDGTKLAFSSQNRVGYDLFLLKYPFEQKERDSLPLTKFRQDQLRQAASLASIATNPDAKDADTVDSYGAFDISFDTEQRVQPNEDVAMQPTTSGAMGSGGDADAYPIREYKVTFSPDIVTGNAGYSNWFGAQGAIQMMFSDMLGDHEIYFMANLFVDLSNSNFFLSYRYLPQTIDYSVAAFHNAGYTFVGGYFNRLRNYGLIGSMSYPLSKFMRFDLGTQATVMSRENIDIVQAPVLTRYVVVPQASFVLDNTIPGMWAPHDGTRLNMTLEGSPKLGSNGLSFSTLRGDVRHYIALGTDYTFVVRGAGGVSVGGNPQKFFIGGVDGWLNYRLSNERWPFQEPEDFAFTRPGWPLRGFNLNERNGTQYLITNLEFRFPLLFAFQAGPLPTLLQGLQAQLFLDAGGAFDADGVARTDLTGVRLRAEYPVLWSTGFGIRSIALGLPLRFDVAWRRDPGGFSTPNYIFSLGVDF